MRIFENIENNALKYGNKLCMTHGEYSITYRVLANKVDNISRRLLSKWSKGNRILINYVDPIHQIIYFLACTKGGLPAVLVKGNLQSEKMKDIINKIAPSGIIDKDLILPNKLATLPCISKEDIFLGALSSGTTGANKVIWRDHQSWTSAFHSQSDVFSIDSSDNLFLAGSLVYTANLNSALHLLNEGGRVVFAEGLYPRSWINEMHKNNITSIFMVPSNYRILLRIMKEPIHKIHSIVSAGEKLGRESVVDMNFFFPNAKICEYYGASELGHVSFING